VYQEIHDFANDFSEWSVPMHICHISQSAGGVETHILNLLDHTDRSKFRHTVICYTNGTLARSAKDAGAEVVMIPMVREIAPLRDLVSFGRILFIVYRLKPDVIHAHSGKGGIWGRLCGMFLDVPVVFTPNAFSYLGQRGIRRLLVLSIEKLLAYTPSLLVASSPSEAKRAVEEVGWRPERVTERFPNSVEVREKKVEHFQKDRTGVLLIGRLCFQKNPEMLIRVANIVKARNNSVVFTILGAGYSDELGNRIIEMIGNLDLEDVVHIKAWTSPDAVEEELLRTDVFVSTSRYEGCGFAIMEAMEKGVPVVATNIDGSADLVEHGKSGYLVNVDEDERMASYICELASDSQLRKHLGESGRERIAGFFNLRSNIARVESIYCSFADYSAVGSIEEEMPL
jgi:glycosyltransferase involved in cell wall biosynthesis